MHVDPLLASAQRQIKFFRAIQWRGRLLRLMAYGQGPRHEKLMLWAISKAPDYSPEAPYFSQLHQQISLGYRQKESGLSIGQIMSLREQAYALSLVMPVIYHELRPDPAAWIARFIDLDNSSREIIHALSREGALVLTAHTFFHNMLGATLGGLGCRVYGIAAPLGIGEDWPIIGPLTTAVNLGSEGLFNGGKYLYIDDSKALIRGLDSARANHGTIIGLLDHGDQTSKHYANILGWKFGIQSSLIRRWADSADPIYFSLLWPKIGDQGVLIPRWQLKISMLKSTGPTDAQTMINAYARELEHWVEAFPWAWQGFRWTQSFP